MYHLPLQQFQVNLSLRRQCLSQIYHQLLRHFHPRLSLQRQCLRQICLLLRQFQMRLSLRRLLLLRQFQVRLLLRHQWPRQMYPCHLLPLQPPLKFLPQLLPRLLRRRLQHAPIAVLPLAHAMQISSAFVMMPVPLIAHKLTNVWALHALERPARLQQPLKRTWSRRTARRFLVPKRGCHGIQK
jgi:hypothetical protein